MFVFLLIFFTTVLAQNSTVSTVDLLPTVPPFGNIVTLIPYSAVQDSRIIVELTDSTFQTIYGSGYRDVRGGNGDTRVTVPVRGILPQQPSFQMRVFIFSQADINDPNPISKASDVEFVSVTATNASANGVYSIKVWFNFSSICGILEDELMMAFQANPPADPAPSSLGIRLTSCTEYVGNSRVTVDFTIADGNLTTRLDNLYAIYDTFVNSNYFASISSNISTPITVDFILVTSYEFDTNPTLFKFWQVFGTMIAVVGWFGIFVVVLNIIHSALTDPGKAERV